MLQEFNELVLTLGSFINTIVSYPSQYIPLISPNLVLVLISILFGYFYGKKAMLGLKTVTAVVFSILFFGFMKFIGVA